MRRLDGKDFSGDDLAALGFGAAMLGFIGFRSGNLKLVGGCFSMAVEQLVIIADALWPRRSVNVYGKRPLLMDFSFSTFWLLILVGFGGILMGFSFPVGGCGGGGVSGVHEAINDGFWCFGVLVFASNVCEYVGIGWSRCSSGLSVSTFCC